MRNKQVPQSKELIIMRSIFFLTVWLILACNSAKAMSLDMSHPAGLLLSVAAGNITSNSCSASLASSEDATIVLGHADFVTGGSGSGTTQMNTPQGIVHDLNGGVWVSDTHNYRILHFPSTVVSGGAPDIILGTGSFGSGANQFNAAQHLALDSSGGLWVADMSNHRVLHFPNGVVTGGSADIQIGAGVSGVSDKLLNLPKGVAVDSSGGLWVADSGNNRILHFSAPIPATNASADTVLGQPSFTSGSLSSPSSSTFSTPNAVAAEAGGGVWVSDTINRRILHFAGPVANAASADFVLGQANFTSTVNTTTQNGLWTPTGIATDAGGGLWVADYPNARALHYSAPYSNGKNADKVLGELDYTTNNSSSPPVISATRLVGPNALTVTPCGQLWVADYSASRVLFYP